MTVTAGQRITASGTLSLGGDLATAYGSYRIVQGGVCASFGTNPVGPLGGGSYPVTEPTAGFWNTFPGSASAQVNQTGTWQVGMCAFVGNADWSFVQVISKGFAQVTN